MALKSIGSQISNLSSRLSSKGKSTIVNKAKLYGRKWREYRDEFLSLNPWCVFCLSKGIRTRATVCDHIEAHKGNEELFWDPDNHQALCKSCHDRTKQQIERFRQSQGDFHSRSDP